MGCARRVHGRVRSSRSASRDAPPGRGERCSCCVLPVACCLIALSDVAGTWPNAAEICRTPTLGARAAQSLGLAEDVPDRPASAGLVRLGIDPLLRQPVCHVLEPVVG